MALRAAPPYCLVKRRMNALVSSNSCEKYASAVNMAVRHFATLNSAQSPPSEGETLVLTGSPTICTVRPSASV